MSLSLLLQLVKYQTLISRSCSPPFSVTFRPSALSCSHRHLSNLCDMSSPACPAFLSPFSIRHSSTHLHGNQRCFCNPRITCVSTPAMPYSGPFIPNPFQFRTTLQSNYRTDALPPGTTSLLICIDSNDAAEMRKWLSTWLREYLFGSQGTMTVPLSMDVVKGQSLLYFYASAGDVRGVLTFSVEENDYRPKSFGKGLFIRVTSSSRFVNPSGTFSATLPGERRIVRTLFADMGTYMFEKVQVVYKPPYIRLKQSKTYPQGLSRGPSIVVFVGEVRDVERSQDVVDFLHSWGSQSQFGAGFGRGLFGNARAPPISTQATPDGIKIITVCGVDGKHTGQGHGNQSELLLKVKEKPGKNQLFTKTSRRGKKRNDRGEFEENIDKSMLIIASSTDPENRGVKTILDRYELTNFQVLSSLNSSLS